jgi:hypothetical protein
MLKLCTHSKLLLITIAALSCYMTCYEVSPVHSTANSLPLVIFSTTTATTAATVTGATGSIISGATAVLQGTAACMPQCAECSYYKW